jgi:hypothetical protein
MTLGPREPVQPVVQLELPLRLPERPQAPREPESAPQGVLCLDLDDLGEVDVLGASQLP